jgi:protein-tyrosine phosphatase
VLLGAVGVLDELPTEVDAVVSLCRLGAAQVPERITADDQHRVWLIDSSATADNPHLDEVLLDAANAVAALRAEGKTVLLHCVQAQSRTPTVAALYAARHLGVQPDAALAEVCAVLPAARPNSAFLAAYARLT